MNQPSTPIRSDAGTVAGGTIERVRLEAGGIAVELLTVGAAINRVVVDGRDIVLAHPNATDYADSMYGLGLTIGRFANRIGGGRFTLDGVEHRLPTNEGDNTLHGGPDGFARRLWDVTDLAPGTVEFTLTSPDGDQGFPGAVTVRVRYTLTADELRMDYTATSTAPTPVNLTNHAYLNPAGEASGSADELLLTVHAAHLVEVDETLIPTGRLPEVGAHDLRGARRVADAAPLDTCFVVDGEPGALRPHATLAASDLAVDVFSDQPGVQVFTADGMSGVPGLSGPYGPRAGVALETQNFPDAPNHPGFPDSILRPGHPLTTSTAWRFRRLG
ncbi:MAG: aldose epimerase family protein [Micropruina sp.]|uniref:aldose epimerase family protein n=1 Tax=Micropruina sp. TaxID=2737536 RepID=UPI0039E3A646